MTSMLSSIQPREAAMRARRWDGGAVVRNIGAEGRGERVERGETSRILGGPGWEEMLRIAIDTGGTFTDCVTMVEGEVRVVKVRSTPGDPGTAVMVGVS